jgi:hypothetical protein
VNVPTRHRAFCVTILSLALLLTGRQQALGLATEHFGNAPVSAGAFRTFTADLLPVLNDPARVYWYEVNGDAYFYFKGDTDVLNAMLKRFAAGGKGREVVLHAGPLERTNLGGTRPVEAGWYVHVPGGFAWPRYADRGLVTDTGPAIHIYLPRPRVRSPAAPARLDRWIADLDSDDLKVRENASRALDKQGQAAEAALRKAMKATGSAEVRKRIRSLLAKLPPLSLEALVIPEGTPALGPEVLLARCTKGLKSKEYVIRGVAASNLARLEPDRKKAVEGLLKVLKEDRHEYVRRSVAGALLREGWAARFALPELRKFVDDPDVNVKNAFRQAVAGIEKARQQTGGEKRARLIVAVQKDIAAYLKARAARAVP